MNILIVGKFYKEAFGLHLKETFEDMGHNVKTFDPGIKFYYSNSFLRKLNSIRFTLHDEVLNKIPSYQKNKTKKLFKQIGNQSIDLILVLHDYLLPEQVATLKKQSKAPVALWFPDPLSNIKRAMFTVAAYDYLFFADRYISNILKADLGLNAFYLPQACYPKYHKKENITETEFQKYTCDITNAGNMYPSRAALYKQLSDYNIKMWGSPPAVWLNIPEVNKMMQNQVVHHEEKAKAFRSAKIVLNNIHPAVVDGINRRAFEIPACGGFQIIRHTPAVEEAYIPEKEAITYKTIGELKEKIAYYLQHDDERKTIAHAGMKRTHRDHTFEIRLKEMLSIVFN